MRLPGRVSATAALVWLAIAAGDAAVPQAPRGVPAPILDAFTKLDEGRFDEARGLLEAALADARAGGHRHAEAHALRGLGRLFAHLNDPDRARQALGDARVIFEREQDHAGLAQVWNQVGTNAYYGQRWEEALEGYRRSVAAFEYAGLPGEAANVLRNLTFVPTLPLAERLSVIEQAATRARAAHQPLLEGLSLHTWSDLLVLNADYVGAMARLAEADALLTRHGTLLVRARMHTSRGRLYRLHGESDLALAEYRKALALQRQSKDVAGEVQTLTAIAIAEHAAQRTRPATAAFEAALSLSRTVGAVPLRQFVERQFGTFLAETGSPRRGIAVIESGLAGRPADVDRLHATTALASALLAIGAHTRALTAASEAVALADALDDPAGRWRAVLVRGRVHRAVGDAAAAEADARTSLERLEALRPNLLQEDALRIGFAGRVRGQYDFSVAVLLDQGLVADAMVAAEMGRARAFRDLLASPRGIRGSVTRPVSAPASFASLTAVAATEQATVVSYWVTANATFIFVLTPDGSVHARRAAVSAARVSALVRATSPGAPGNDAAWRALYDLLVLPVRRWLPAATGAPVILVPDGVLHRLSFAALRHERGRYLVEGYELRYTSSLAALADARDRADKAGQADLDAASTTHLVVADPAVPPDVARRHRLLRLPGARREAATIDRYSGSPVTQLAAADATEGRVRLAATSAAAVVHFAVHGVVLDDRPFDSFLALASGPGEADDGMLTAREIYAWRLPASLVVLSACNSGAGPVTGDGIVSLTRAFLVAGARRVVASAWDLPDDVAPQLFQRFYVARAGGARDSAALRTAQIAVLRSLRAGTLAVETAAGRFTLSESPFVWAGLQVWG
jgi:CHAT domain-containing protein/tetratricopeptide (TPR) repeat protein